MKKIKQLIFQKKAELAAIKKKGSEEAKMTKLLKDKKSDVEERSGLIYVKTVKDIVEQFSDYQTFDHHIQNQLLREKELRDSMENKLKMLHDKETSLMKINSNIENMFSGRIMEISRKISLMQKSYYDMDNKIKIIEIDRLKNQKERSQIRSGVKLENNNEKTSSEYNLFNKPNCNKRKNCFDCLEESSCVWCSIGNNCVPGDVKGPTDGSCGMSFIYGSCPESFCSIFKDCTKCIENDSCGWCPSKNQCYEGNKYGLNGVTCNEFIHIFNEKKCSKNGLK